ncbi:MAG: cell wall-active antibiotics response protein [Ignavibacteria bacterium]|nr:cell wall-active antibiotics response protein [Ignavibacteria bacterium]
MKLQTAPYRLLTIPLLFVLMTAGDGASAQSISSSAHATREIGRTTEKEVNIVLTSAFGSVTITRGEAGKILIAEPSPDADTRAISITYSVRNRVGYLEIALGEESDGKGSSGNWNVQRGTWNLEFCDAIPLSFDIELGLGNGNFDLSGLQVKDFTLSSGASDVAMNFDEKNSALIERMSIESGVSKFDGRNLGNANFRRFRFSGGVGTYYLDFGGNLTREADIDIDVGLGVLTMIVPNRVGARLLYEKSWVSRLDCDKGFRPISDVEYMTDNYNDTDGRVNIRIESGLGSVRVIRE